MKHEERSKSGRAVRHGHRGRDKTGSEASGLRRAALATLACVLTWGCGEASTPVPSEHSATPGHVQSALTATGQTSSLAAAGAPKGAASSGACSLLQDPGVMGRISGALELRLRHQCGQLTPSSTAGTVESAPQGRSSASTSAPLGSFALEGLAAFAGSDVLVNDPNLDTGGSTQSETSVVANGNVVCAAWNDSGEGFGLNGFSGFGYSLDGGLTWTDGGPFPNGPADTNFGDPSLAYSARDNTFYYAALSSFGLSLWRSGDDCQSFEYVGPIHSGFDDKELMAVDNTPSSPFYGRIYVGWTDFGAFVPNVAAYSDDGGVTWSPAIAMPGSENFFGQGMWPAVAPNGDAYMALVSLALDVGGLQDQVLYRSTDGGDTWERATDIASGQLRPEQVSSSNNCGRQALNGDIRLLSSPQIVIAADSASSVGYTIHAVYPYDSDGAGLDNSNVFYRSSTDAGLSWGPEILLNDDGGTTDQFFPALGVSETGQLAASWYDRRNDPEGNLLQDRYLAYSSDGGASWSANERLSDVSSPIAQTNPNFDGLAFCYHGDYDQVSVGANTAHVIWSDDRRETETGPNPDVYYDQFIINPSLGRIRASAAAVACESSIAFTLSDADLEGAGTQPVTVVTTGGDVETLVLTEAGTPGTFTGGLATTEGTAVPESGVLEVFDGATITATYADADDGFGNPAQATVSARVDCAGPEVLDVRLDALSGIAATIAVDVSEPASLRVSYGFSCAALDQVAASPGVAPAPRALLTGLVDGTQYFYAVTVTDAVGNATYDDNGGSCYSFETLDVLYREDFEAGDGGFVFDNGIGNGNGLWHVSSSCAAQVFGHSVPRALYYGQDTTCTFNNGLTNEGVATSPQIELGSSSFATVEFNYFLGTEGGGFYDQASLEVSVNGTPFVVVESNFSVLFGRRFIRTRDNAVGAGGAALTENTARWQHASADLTPYLQGQESTSIQLRVHFNTVDSVANDFAGFYVDDLFVFGEAADVPCSVDAECDDGLFCSGVETCEAGICRRGTPLVCSADDGVGCTDAVCDEATEGCVLVANDEHCDDGNFCNGFETCDPVLDCQPPAEPISCVEDGIECTTDVCVEELKGCSSIPDDLVCDDGLFCTGFEFCNPALGCQSTGSPCDDGVSCSIDICHEQEFFCEFVPDDTRCDDGIFCTGQESCEAFVGCRTTDPCPGPDSCDEAAQQCVPVCFADTNGNHQQAGRAYAKRSSYLAVGSNDALGKKNDVTSLQGGEGFWERVDSCPAAPVIESFSASIVGNGVTFSGQASDVNHDIAEVRVTITLFFQFEFTIVAQGTEDFSVTTFLPQGFHLATVQAIDQAGLISAPSEPVFLDILSAQRPNIDSIELSVNGDTVDVFGTAFDVNGDIEYVEVTILQGGSVVAATMATGTTDWAATFSDLAQGTYQARAHAVDQEGLVSEFSPLVEFEIEGGDAASCVDATNEQHKSAGRATRSGNRYRAVGSGDDLGKRASSKNALLGSDAYWELVNSCK